jgi:hypothetical protein
MVLRWMAAGMGEAAKQFRRVNGYLYLPALRAALDATIAVTPTKEDAARSPDGPPPKFHGTRDILAILDILDCGPRVEQAAAAARRGRWLRRSARIPWSQPRL